MEKNKVWIISFMSLVLLSGLGATLFGQAYPAPRYPKGRHVDSAEDILDIARLVVRKPSRREPLRPGYDVKPGENILMVIPNDFNPLVRDALAMAIREIGARLDILLIHPNVNPDVARRASRGLPPDGSVEATRMLEPRQGGGGGGSNYIRKVMALAEAGQVDLVIEGGGGPQPISSYRWERIPWSTVEKFYISASFPSELQDLIDQKIWDTYSNARSIHVQDPEGTDITWSVRPEHFDKLRQEYEHPLYPPGTYDIVKRGHLSLEPLFVVMPDTDARGVVAGTINHAGVFPRVKLHMEGGKIVRAEGGGRYGEAVQELITKYANVQYPGFPGPGIGWLEEVAVGTNPRRGRVSTVTKGEGMSWERGRSGVIHWGLGVTLSPTSTIRDEYNAKREAENLPGGHFHIHTYFNTVDMETRDGKTVRVIDKGHITFLDDPDVRALAAKYGDPDEVLQEAWIPAIPGISIPGNYENYAADPGPWVGRDVEQIDKQLEAAER